MLANLPVNAKTECARPFRVAHAYHANTKITLANLAQVIRANALFHRRLEPPLSNTFGNFIPICAAI